MIVNGILIDGETCQREVTIPKNVTRIGECAFSNCTGLTSITIPGSVTSIEYSAFSGCNNLTEITVPCDSTLKKDAFGDASEKVKYRHSLVKSRKRGVLDL
ncbi:leucine-rich repeat domain-containing protein [Ruminococcus callidus]|uniref:leucine-rich repeat domain-containing protein n=1 Tax=Ruminococcus callidus TaxID=40519 RepID=UPI0023F90F8F|nr:leucine-rich repeat domain-containing protein [Ruminococcus callidus]